MWIFSHKLFLIINYMRLLRCFMTVNRFASLCCHRTVSQTHWSLCPCVAYLLWRDQHRVGRRWFRGVLPDLGFPSSGHRVGDEPLVPGGTSVQNVSAVRAHHGLGCVSAGSCHCSVPTHDGLSCVCHGPRCCSVPVHLFFYSPCPIGYCLPRIRIQCGDDDKLNFWPRGSNRTVWRSCPPPPKKIGW